MISLLFFKILQSKSWCCFRAKPSPFSYKNTIYNWFQTFSPVSLTFKFILILILGLIYLTCFSKLHSILNWHNLVTLCSSAKYSMVEWIFLILDSIIQTSSGSRNVHKSLRSQTAHSETYFPSYSPFLQKQHHKLITILLLFAWQMFTWVSFF